MEPAQIWTLFLGSSVIGGIAVKLLDLWRDKRAGAIAERRAEVEKAVARALAAEQRERETQEAAEQRERETREAADARVAKADSEADWWARWSRIVEEHAAEVRLIVMNKLGADMLPKYPARPNRE